MDVKINNKKYSFENKITITTMLRKLNLAHKPCAVEVNKKIVTSINHHNFILSEGDEIEIVTLVGGG